MRADGFTGGVRAFALWEWQPHLDLLQRTCSCQLSSQARSTYFDGNDGAPSGRWAGFIRPILSQSGYDPARRLRQLDRSASSEAAERLGKQYLSERATCTA